MYNCINDIFGYCHGEPEFDVERVPGTRGHCRRDYKNCIKHMTSLQQARTLIDQKKDELDNWTQYDNFLKFVAYVEKREAEVV